MLPSEATTRGPNASATAAFTGVPACRPRAEILISSLRQEGLLMKGTKGVTRGKILLGGVAAVAAGATLIAEPQQGPAVVTRRRFRAWISRGNGPGRTS